MTLACLFQGVWRDWPELHTARRLAKRDVPLSEAEKSVDVDAYSVSDQQRDDGKPKQEAEKATEPGEGSHKVDPNQGRDEQKGKGGTGKKSMLTDLIDPATLQPYYFIPISSCVFILLQSAILGFDVRLQRDQDGDGWYGWLKAGAKNAGLVAFIGMALVTWWRDTSEFLAAPTETIADKVSAVFVIGFTSPNMKAAWGAFATVWAQSPANVFPRSACHRKPNYDTIPLIGGGQIPLQPFTAGWMQPLKWAYLMVLLPYHYLSGTLFTICVGSCKCIQGCFTIKFFCFVLKAECCWLLWLLLSVCSLGIWSHARESAGFWWQSIWPLLVTGLLQLWAVLVGEVALGCYVCFLSLRGQLGGMTIPEAFMARTFSDFGDLDPQELEEIFMLQPPYLRDALPYSRALPQDSDLENAKTADDAPGAPAAPVSPETCAPGASVTSLETATPESQGEGSSETSPGEAAGSQEATPPQSAGAATPESEVAGCPETTPAGANSHEADAPDAEPAGSAETDKPSFYSGEKVRAVLRIRWVAVAIHSQLNLVFTQISVILQARMFLECSTAQDVIDAYKTTVSERQIATYVHYLVTLAESTHQLVNAPICRLFYTIWNLL